jgi:hypothetical protein
MATKADFTEQEWETMQRGLTGAGLLVALADRDFTDSFGESKALAKYLAEQQQASDSTLIRDLAHVHGSGFGLKSNPERVESETLAALQEAVATLSSKAADEVEAYRTLVIGLAEHVAEAKSGVADTETAAVDKIRQALG